MNKKTLNIFTFFKFKIILAFTHPWMLQQAFSV